MIGQRPGIHPVSFGERNPGVNPQEIRVIRGCLVLDDHNDVVHHGGNRRRQGVEGLGNQLLEFLPTHGDHLRSVTGDSKGPTPFPYAYAVANGVTVDGDASGPHRLEA